jgi:hypothetical protein
MRFQCIEDELLVLLARSNLDALNRERAFQILAQGVDLDLLFAQAYLHGVMPLIYTNLQALNHPLTKTALWQQYKGDYLTSTIRNMELTAELMAILRLLLDAGINVVPLKGPVLAERLYGDISLRMFSDLDILVPKNQFVEAIHVLVNRGYVYRNHLQPTVPDGKHDCQLVRNDRMYVELHWTLEPPDFSTIKNTQLFWQTTHSISWADQRVLWPTDEELLLFLCRHGSRHHWGSLKWLCDVAELLSHCEDFDWQYVLRRVERTRTRRLVFLGLHLANRLLDTTFPANVWGEIKKDRNIEELADRAIGWMFLPSDPNNLDRYWAQQMQLVRLREGYLQRLKYVYTKLIRPKLTPTVHDRSLIQLPNRLAFFYYILRPLRLVLMYGSIWMNVVKKESKKR